MELHGRVAEGSASDNPVIDLGLRATAATAPELHAIAAKPIDADMSATLRGLADFAPKPWPARFRELQARGGRIDIVNARIQQGEVIAVSTGSLSLTPSGNLDGQLQMTVVGLEHVLKQLDLEAIVSQGRVGSAIDKLDKLLARARQHRPQERGAGHPGRPRRHRKAHDARGQARDDRAAALRRRPGDARAAPGRPHAAAVLITTLRAYAASLRLGSRKRPTKIARQRLPVR